MAAVRLTKKTIRPVDEAKLCVAYVGREGRAKNFRSPAILATTACEEAALPIAAVATRCCPIFKGLFIRPVSRLILTKKIHFQEVSLIGEKEESLNYIGGASRIDFRNFIDLSIEVYSSNKSLFSYLTRRRFLIWTQKSLRGTVGVIFYKSRPRKEDTL